MWACVCVCSLLLHWSYVYVYCVCVHDCYLLLSTVINLEKCGKQFRWANINSRRHTRSFNWWMFNFKCHKICISIVLRNVAFHYKHFHQQIDLNTIDYKWIAHTHSPLKQMNEKTPFCAHFYSKQSNNHLYRTNEQTNKIGRGREVTKAEFHTVSGRHVFVFILHWIMKLKANERSLFAE